MSDNTIASSYDAVVIGAGIGGLTAGALLAHAGKRVLIVEKEAAPGGYARALLENNRRFDPAVQLILGCAPESPAGLGIVDAVMQHLQVREQCEFIKVNPFYRVEFPGMSLDVPSGHRGYVEAHSGLFPDEADGLERLLALCARVSREIGRVPIAPRMRDKLLLPLRFTTLFRHMRVTVQQVIDRYLSDPKLKAFITALAPYTALPPSRTSFLVWARMMAEYIEGGAYYCRGGFQHLADALVHALRNRDGMLLVNRRVTAIRADDRRVRGVTLDDGQTIAAPVVISNIDARETFHTLLGPGQVPEDLLRKIDRLEPSLSVLSLYLSTDLDLRARGIPHETVIYRTWDTGQMIRDGIKGKLSGLTVTIPTLNDSSLAPDGEHLVSLMGFVGSDESFRTGEFKRHYAERLLEEAEKLLPGLREHITFAAGRKGPEDNSLPLLRLGPMYGWAATPEQTGPFRLPNTTPLPGLYLAGHWTQPGYGISSVLQSGVRVARLILKKNTSKGLLPIRL